ncbi:TPA: hypothetical protein ACGQ50_000808 [Enterobacter cloacae]
MKPMLKTAFFSLVNDLLSRGIRPVLKAEPNLCVGVLQWEGHQEYLYWAHDASPLTARTSRKRFVAWFAEIMTAYHAKIAENYKVGDRVLDGDDERTVTGFRTVAPRDSIGNKTNGVCARTGVIVLDGKIEVMAGDVWPSPEAVEEMPARKPSLLDLIDLTAIREPTDEDLALAALLNGEVIDATTALETMAETVARHMVQSQKPDFDAAAAYADIKANYDDIKIRCNDHAIVVWLKQHLCFGYMGTECTFIDVNGDYLKQISHILQTGWRPQDIAGDISEAAVYEMEWWGAADIQVTKREKDRVYGTATVTDTEGLYQIAFDWLMDMGEEAKSCDLPALVSITAGKFVLPHECRVMETEERAADPLAVIQEMDCVFGFCGDVFSEIYHKEAPTKG